MKRSSAIVLVSGIAAAVLAAVLHVTGVWRPIEHGIALVTHNPGLPTLAGELLLALITIGLGVLVAWLTASSSQRSRIGILVAALAVELLLASWVCGLYGVTFQPL